MTPTSLPLTDAQTVPDSYMLDAQSGFRFFRGLAYILAAQAAADVLFFLAWKVF